MSKDKIVKNIIMAFALILTTTCIYLIYITQKESYAAKIEEASAPTKNDIKLSNAKCVDIEKIINENLKGKQNREELFIQEEELEYITKYIKNDDLYKGTTKVSQEGRNGTQKITTKKTYDENNNLIKEEQISIVVTKASINKIIDVGTKEYVYKEQESTNKLSFDIALNKPSGFSLEQFKKALTDEKDKNKIFEQNAEYFHYIEEEYNINGMFVAAVGIHESAWGTSKIAIKKYNLFGYGAYDLNPYNGAYEFESYSESIDLLARVFVKYYINPSGTRIYDGEIANGKYYHGSTLSGVNKSYATDKKWANGVYRHMEYLYNKLY